LDVVVIDSTGAANDTEFDEEFEDEEEGQDEQNMIDFEVIHQEDANAYPPKAAKHQHQQHQQPLTPCKRTLLL
jgi:hypothetical protein